MRKLILGLALLGAFTMSGCSLNQMIKKAQEQDLTVSPDPLEVHADSVSFEMSAVLPVKMLKKGKVYTVNTFYQYGSEEEELEGLEFVADDFPESNESQPRKSKNFSFAYDPAMKEGELIVQGVASNPSNGKAKTTDRMPVAEGLITTSKMVKDVYFAAYADHGYNTGEELEPTDVDFYFLQGSSVLRTSEKRSDRGKFFQAFVAEKNLTRTVNITGTHSPEGPERINSTLAEDRAKAIEDYYQQMMKRYDYTGTAAEIEFVRKPVVEDWAMLKDALKDYKGINDNQKKEWMDIINGSGNFEAKEKRLQRLSTYRKVFNDIYPDLRTAKTEILTVKDKKTEAEIALLAKEITKGEVSADTLSDAELAFSATLTTDLNERKSIYEAAVKKNDSWASHNNLGAVHLEMAMEADSEDKKMEHVEKALTHFQTSVKKEESAEVLNNMAVAFLMQGDVEKAKANINKAAVSNPSEDISKGLNGVKGALEIKSADYDMAVNTLSNAEETKANMFNYALAQLLNKEYENAYNSFTNLISKKSDYANAEYGAAIAAARLNKSEEVYKHIRAAAQKNTDLKQDILKDLEFKNFRGQDLENALK
ncbi:MAG: hypothetical protein JJU23_14345 [Cyclobacteriaceae bacterium]|nr:hypothetical protein [Cyclobacteriaceae bacterium]